MTRTRYTLDDLGAELPERALLAFLRRLPAESETAVELSPEAAGWTRSEMLLARLCEGIETLTWVEICKGSRKSKRPPRPKRIPRPGVSDDAQHIGREPIPISEFDKWFYGGEG